jgi:hypothetical protein
MAGATCALCGYAWNLPENRRCGRCLQTLVVATGPVAAASRSTASAHEWPRNSREMWCLLPLLVGAITGGLLGGILGGACSVLLLRVAHSPKLDRVTQGLLMAGVLLGGIAAEAVALLAMSTVLHGTGVLR